LENSLSKGGSDGWQCFFQARQIFQRQYFDSFANPRHQTGQDGTRAKLKK
jgi:hypothetical protein